MEKTLNYHRLNDMDEITVIIPTHNRERLLRLAIESVSKQTLLPSEVIVVDDGSTDQTRELIESLSKRSPFKLTYLYKENAGPSAARNAGLALCKTPWVAFLDSDDEWHSEKLQLQMEAARAANDPKLGLVFCRFELIDEQGQSLPGTCDFDPTIRGDVFSRLLHGNKVAGSGSAVLIRKECFDRVGGFDERLQAAEDWDMWLRIAREYHLTYADRTLTRIRRHPDHQHIQKDQARMLRNDIDFYAKWALAVPADQIPFAWAKKLAEFAALSLPQRAVIQYIYKALGPEAERKIFQKTYGSFRLHMFFKLSKTVLTAVTDSIYKSLLYFYGALKSVGIYIIFLFVALLVWRKR